MSLDISSIRDSWLEGGSQFDEFMIGFELDWNRPDLLLAIASDLASTPPEVISEMRRLNPKIFDAVAREVNYGTSNASVLPQSERESAGTPKGSFPGQDYLPG
jgi:hypothetical protein